MSPELQRELSSRGGTAAQEKGTGHRFRTSAEAKRAGRKGAALTNAKRKKEAA